MILVLSPDNMKAIHRDMGKGEKSRKRSPRSDPNPMPSCAVITTTAQDGIVSSSQDAATE